MAVGQKIIVSTETYGVAIGYDEGRPLAKETAGQQWHPAYDSVPLIVIPLLHIAGIPAIRYLYWSGEL